VHNAALVEVPDGVNDGTHYLSRLLLSVYRLLCNLVIELPPGEVL
jgi:hypothetical protein